jgi:hypothetical protein
MSHNQRMQMYRSRRHEVMVDFDGTLSRFKYPDIGPPLPGAREFLEELRRMGLYIIIFTARMSPDFRTVAERGEMLHEIEAWMDKHYMPYDEIDLGNSGKRLGMAYIDDRGVAAGVDIPWEDVLDRVRKIKRREDARWRRRG